MDEGEEMSLDQDVDALKKHVGAMDIRLEALEDHREEHVDPTIRRMETDMAAMRADLRVMGVQIGNCATKDHVIDIIKKIDESNQNMAVALATPSKDQADRNAVASFWIAALGSIAMVVTAVVGAYAIFHH